ncbi:MAG: DUF47 family protein [Paludibacter sp.]|nr:DUF47 family protein [Paludibacter sp.]MDD4427310.1 DUF47 family protein [Paludibacter sp.]
MLDEMADVLVEGANQLELIFSSSKDQIKDCCHRIKDEEVKGDKITGRISRALNDTFITPFDREDIHALSDRMDDVIDTINRSAQKIMLYEPNILPKYMERMAVIIKQSTHEIRQAINELPNLRKNDKNIRQYCKQIKTWEREADVIYDEGIIRIFHEKMNTVELIKMKEILFELEMSVNKINQTGKFLKTIVVKYA